MWVMDVFCWARCAFIGIKVLFSQHQLDFITMDIQGKIIFALEPRSGESRNSGNNWKAQDFVIETHDQYPRKCCFTVFGEDRLNQFNIQVGEEMTVSLDIDAHEYNGRWYNSLRAWKVQRGGQAPATPTVNGGAAPAVPGGQIAAPLNPMDAPADNSQDDLPF